MPCKGFNPPPDWPLSRLLGLPRHIPITFQSNTLMNKILLTLTGFTCFLCAPLALNGAVVVYQNGVDPNGVDPGTYSGQFDVEIRNGGGAYFNLLVGSAGTTNIARGLLSFDLSSLDASWTINSATLRVGLYQPDGSSVDGGQLDLHELSSGFGASADWNTSDGTTSWSSAGGDFSSTVLSSINPDLNSDAFDTLYTFSSSAAFVSSVAGSAGGTLNLLMKRSDDASATDRFFAFLHDYDSATGSGSILVRPRLEVDYTVPEPSTMALYAGFAALGLILYRRRRQ